MKAALTTVNLSKDEMKKILVSHGVADAEAEQTAATLAQSSSNVAATTTTNLLSGALTRAKVAAKGLSAAIKANPFLVVATAVAGLIAGLKYLSEIDEKNAEKAKEASEASMQSANAKKEESNKISELIAKYKELANSEVQDSDTRAEISEIQDEITKLVGDQADNLDLVNGKLDEEINKLKEIQKNQYGSTSDSYEKAYMDAKTATEKYNVHHGNWWDDLSKDHNALTIDYWGNNSERDTALKFIDKAWREKGYGSAETGMLNGLFYQDTYSQLNFNPELNYAERIKAIDAAIEALKDAAKTDNFDYENNGLWKKLIEIRDELAGENGLFTAQSKAASELANSLLDNLFIKWDINASNKDIQNFGVFAEYKKSLIDALSDNDVIEQAIKDGAISSDYIENLVGNQLSVVSEQYANFQKIDEKIKEIKKNFANNNSQKTDFNDWVDALSDEDKEIVYKIAIDTDTANYTLEDWKNALDNAFVGDTNDAIQQYYDTLKKVSDLQIDTGKTVYGNIDTNNRQKIKWTEENLQKYKAEIESWGNTIDDYRDSFSTVVGTAAAYDGVEIAFSPMLQTDNGAEFLSKDTVDKYINGLIDKAGEGWTAEKLLKLDTEGLEVDGKHIKGLIADVGEEAKRTAEIMHFVGKDGALETDYNEYCKAISQITNETKRNINDLWNSENFKESKTSLTELFTKFGKISSDKIKELAKESESLKNILDQDGMSAEFLANIFGNMAVGNDGISLITDDALKLNDALNGMSDAFDEIRTAKEKYDSAMSIDEKDTNFKSYAEAYKTLNEQFTKGTTNSNAFWASAEFIFGADKLKEVEYSVDSIYKMMSSSKEIFDDEDSAGLGFLDKLYELSTNGSVLDKAGNIIAGIQKSANGSYDIDIDYDNIDAVAEKMNLSRESVLSCLEAISMYADIDFYNIEEVERVIKDIGIAADYSGKKVVNANKLTEQLFNLGKSNKEIQDIIKNLQELGDVSFLNTEMQVDDLIGSLENLGMAAKDGTSIEINYSELLKLMKDIGFTKTQAEDLVKKLGEVDGIQFVKQLGTGNGGVTDINGVLSEISTMDFTSAENGVDGVTGAVNNLTETLKGLDGKSISVRIDVVGSIKDVLNWLNGSSWVQSSTTGGTNGFANGTSNAPSGTALVGEEGEELVQSGDKAYFVGSHGAEFVRLKQGDRVYTAAETKKIKRSGKSLKGNVPAFYKGGAYGTVGKGSYSSLLDDSSSKGSGNTSTSSSNSTNSSKDSEKDFQTFDWIEIAIKRIESAVGKLKNIASSTYNSIKTKLGASADEISKVNEELAIQRKAYDRYLSQANSVGLSSELAEKVRNGTIDIEEYDSDTQKLIKSYQDWYEEALSCSDAIDELHDSLASIYESNFNAIKDDYSNRLSEIEHISNIYQSELDLIEERGYTASAAYYSKLRDIEKKNIQILKDELSALKSKFDEAIKSKEIEEYSDAWYSMKNEINSVEEAISEANTKLVEYGNSMRQIKWDMFDFKQDRVDQITQEADFLIDLLSNKELYDDKGQFSEYGLATAGLRMENYNVYMLKAKQYAEELLEINKELANDPYNQTLIERREELLGLQQDLISSAEDEKKAIKDLVSDGINAELDSLKELIDTYTNALDSAKSLNDYQKSVSDKTSEISSLKKQLLAYAGDNSEETKATIQKLNADLKKAEKDLQDTEYDRYISDQKELLDNLYTEYETTLNQRLDNIDALISDISSAVNNGASDINATISSISGDVGYAIGDSLSDIWDINKNNESDFDSSYDIASKILEVINTISENVQSILLGDVNNDGNITAEDARKALRIAARLENPTVYEKTVSDINGDGNVSAGEARDILRKSARLKSYSTGGLVDYTGIAQVDGTPGKPELVLNATDTQNFLELNDLLKALSMRELTVQNYGGYDAPVLNSSVSAEVSKMVEKFRTSDRGNSGTTIGDIQINIPIERVSDYNDFVNQLRNDKKFENMILDVTVGKLSGGNSLSKNKYQW